MRRRRQKARRGPPAVAAGMLLALAATTSAAAPGPDEDAVSAECVLMSIEMVTEGENTLLELATDGSPTSLGTRHEPEDEVVLDLTGCVPGPELSGGSFPTGLVSSLRLIHRSDGGAPVLAVAVTARQAFEHAVRSSPDLIEVRLQPRAVPQAAVGRLVEPASPGAEPPQRVRVLEPLPGPAAASDTPPTVAAPDTATAARLLEGARESVARAPKYDPQYRVIAYPGGDPGWQRGAATDLVVRAYRELGVDLQQRVHEDVLANPEAYGIHQPDPNVDHRRVRNLFVFFRRHAEELPADRDADWRPGDVVFWALGGSRPNRVGIVSDRRAPDGRTLAIHHSKDRVPAEEDVLFAWPIVGHFRWLPEPAP